MLLLRLAIVVMTLAFLVGWFWTRPSASARLP